MQNKKNDSIIGKQGAVESPQVLPGSLWGVAAFFNPVPYAVKLDNYMKFRAANKKQGLKLLTVELAFGDRPFQLQQDDADLLIQIRSDSLLWHKEALLNIGIEQLPQDCDKVVWLDTDVIFPDDNWIIETAKMLQRYKVLQLFKLVHAFDKKGNIDWSAHGSLYRHITGENYTYICPGLAWAIRRELIQKCKIYDAMVLGGGDTLFLHAVLNVLPDMLHSCGNNLLQHYKEWSSRLSDEIKGSYYYLDTEALHLYHGKIINKRYSLRDYWYEKYMFDPYKDIVRGSNGCWMWNSNKTKLAKLVKKYLQSRNEDDLLLFYFIYNIPHFFVRIMQRVLNKIHKTSTGYLYRA